MVFLVISDSHGDRAALSSLILRHKDVDAVFFLGDGIAEVEGLAAEGLPMPVIAVRGNCDSLSSPYGFPRDEELALTFCGRRLLLLHGHTAGAKGGLGGLVAAGCRHGADAVLFGHTHKACDLYIPEGEGGPMWLLNPGSLGHPEDGVPSYGLLTLDDRGDLLFSIGKQRRGL